MDSIKEYLSAIGTKGGKARTPRKLKASSANLLKAWQKTGATIPKKYTKTSCQAG